VVFSIDKQAWSIDSLNIWQQHLKARPWVFTMRIADNQTDTWFAVPSHFNVLSLSALCKSSVAFTTLE
jgi:hypothetical protein